MFGQSGARKGLRGGPPVLDAARSAYLGNEYSGAKDRRPPPGKIDKTEVWAAAASAACPLLDAGPLSRIGARIMSLANLFSFTARATDVMVVALVFSVFG
jgi:hypothetical protein